MIMRLLHDPVSERMFYWFLGAYAFLVIGIAVHIVAAAPVLPTVH